MGVYRIDDAVLVESDCRQQASLIAVLDEMIGESDADEARRMSGFFEYARNFCTGTADDDIFFDADEQRMFPGQFKNQFVVDRFDEAHIGDGGIERFAGFHGGCQRRTEGQQGSACSPAGESRRGRVAASSGPC